MGRATKVVVTNWIKRTLQLLKDGGDEIGNDWEMHTKRPRVVETVTAKVII